MKFRLAARFLPIHPKMRVLGMIPATKLWRMVLMERETHIDKKSKAHVNVVMTTIRHDTIQKAFFVECKRSKPKGIKTTPLKWEKAGVQLQKYMTIRWG
jgi:hypothetical protein